MAKTVVVGMSGGVDSSVAALVLKEAGYNVIGLFMKNWNETDDNGCCTAETDYKDVRRVAQKLKIPYYTVDFSKEYWDGVFQHFVDEYKKGRTPNPDVLCNREIKFGVFKEYAKKLGADYIATGHYCGLNYLNGRVYLQCASDENKDQTYFLNQVTEKQLENVIFPLDMMSKHYVRLIAHDNGLSTAHKKDSTGVCFIGERNFRKFLSQYIPMQKGEIKTLDGKTVGEHDGVFYYTIGQHKGFGLGGVKGADNEKPWYIIRKDVKNNILYVNQGETEDLYSDVLNTEGFNFITEEIPDGKEVFARIRHRQPLQKAVYHKTENGAEIKFEQKQRAIVPGQYCVLYDDEIRLNGDEIMCDPKICLGGGVIV